MRDRMNKAFSVVAFAFGFLASAPLPEIVVGASPDVDAREFQETIG
jgi:hypothetical protein